MRLGIVGYPLSYTQSPALHLAFLKSNKIAGSYDVLKFDPKEGRQEFFRFLDFLARDGYRGLNITVPFKEWAFAYAVRNGGVDKSVHGKSALLVQAANTLVFKAGKVYAANTDTHGIWSDLQTKFGAAICKHAMDLVVVGTGGSARGVIAGLITKHTAARRIKNIQIIGRNSKKVRALRTLVKGRAYPTQPLCLVAWCLPPVGTREAKKIWKTVVGDRDLRSVYLYDLNYGDRALSTKKLLPTSQWANGIGMLERQARASFELWIRR
jgi:shikimate 5-dehydrogenase